MSSEITTYQSVDFGDIRTIVEDGKVLFVAADVARVLSYRDAEHLARLLADDEKSTRLVGTARGQKIVIVVTKEGLFSVILKRRAKYVNDPAARERVEAFQHWVTHEILPALEDKGYYLNVPPEQLAPEDLDRLTAYTMAGLAARNAALERQVEELRPKAEFAEAVSAAPDCIEVRDLGHILGQNGFKGMGRGNTFKFLCEEKYLFKNAAGYKVPYQRWINQGLFEVQETTWTAPDGTVRVSLKTMVTQKGVEHFLRKYAPDRALPGMGLASESGEERR